MLQAITGIYCILGLDNSYYGKSMGQLGAATERRSLLQALRAGLRGNICNFGLRLRRAGAPDRGRGWLGRLADVSARPGAGAGHKRRHPTVFSLWPRGNCHPGAVTAAAVNPNFDLLLGLPVGAERPRRRRQPGGGAWQKPKPRCLS